MRKVYGKGINDSITPVNYFENGIYIRCPYYTVWKSMLMRCYCKPYKDKQKTYIDCHVCEEWLVFSTFKSWMMNQNWKGLHLDKDLIVKGNKIYCPEFCCFIPRHINNFLEMKKEGKGCELLGVTYDKNRDKYASRVRNVLGNDIRNPRRDDSFDSHIDYLKGKIKIGNLYIEHCNDSVINSYLKARLDEMQYCIDNREEYVL